MGMDQSVELTREIKLLGKTCPSATSSNTNFTLIDLGSCPGRGGEKATTNPLHRSILSKVQFLRLHKIMYYFKVVYMRE
jgi:hypothetical protein